MTEPNKSRIIAQIKAILSGIDDSLEDEDKLSMVRGYWEAGRLATEYKDSTGMLLKDIAKEIEVPDWALQRYTQFYKTFPKGYPKKHGNRVVSWTYICCILPVHDAKAREFYLKEACRHGWNKYELTKRIQKDYYGAVEDARTRTRLWRARRSGPGNNGSTPTPPRSSRSLTPIRLIWRSMSDSRPNRNTACAARHQRPGGRDFTGTQSQTICRKRAGQMRRGKTAV